MLNKDKISYRLKLLRQNSGVSTRALAEAIGLKSHGAITQFEKGTALPALDTLVALANYYGVTTDYLLGITDTPFPLSEKVVNIINQANNPEEIIASIKELAQSEKSSRVDEQLGNNKINELIEDLDEESMVELRKYIAYLRIRQTLDSGEDESSAGLDTAENN